jgi:hypothetical protein
MEEKREEVYRKEKEKRMVYVGRSDKLEISSDNVSYR